MAAEIHSDPCNVCAEVKPSMQSFAFPSFGGLRAFVCNECVSTLNRCTGNGCDRPIITEHPARPGMCGECGYHLVLDSLPPIDDLLLANPDLFNNINNDDLPGTSKS